ncbi:ferritin-like domain-containing protein [Halococcus sediminicola]|uniref:ferritin-like domain-containing protein n=1 Tax=Halococcus sediminicola TaxID=1264579 RepID=UPI0006785581|nr:ferritin-like domain-containing protein [Halococcus sediminicola]
MTKRNDSNRTDSPSVFGRASEFVRSRRSFMTDAATVGGGALALSALGGTAAARSGSEDGDGGDVSDVDVLNYALALEHLEAAFYNDFLANHSESDVEGSVVARYFARPTLRYSVYQQIEDVRDHEEAHVDALTETIEDLGGTPVEAAEYEFPYETIEEFVALADRLEAVGVSAYAGAAPLLSNPDLIPPALSIHSVEANHATYFRLLDLQRPAPNAFNPARTMDEVLGIANQFVVGADGGGGRMFSVSVENVSRPSTLDTDRAMGAVPLSPPVWAVFTGDNPAFTPGEAANAGTEIVAEDGFPDELAGTLANAENVTESGVAPSPGGSLETPALGPGESVEFAFSAVPGEHLTFETMFVQSNDWFYTFDGLSLFDGDQPIAGDVTSAVELYDAGTEADTAPGTGPDQKPVQDPEAMDVGPTEDEPVQLAAERHPDFDIPDASEVIRVTVTPQ